MYKQLCKILGKPNKLNKITKANVFGNFSNLIAKEAMKGQFKFSNQ